MIQIIKFYFVSYLPYLILQLINPATCTSHSLVSFMHLSKKVHFVFPHVITYTLYVESIKINCYCIIVHNLYIGIVSIAIKSAVFCSSHETIYKLTSIRGYNPYYRYPQSNYRLSSCLPCRFIMTTPLVRDQYSGVTVYLCTHFIVAGEGLITGVPFSHNQVTFLIYYISQCYLSQVVFYTDIMCTLSMLLVYYVCN